MNTARPHDRVIGAWVWLYPATYLLHIVEEFWGDFPAWLSRFAGARLSMALFLTLNAIALCLMTTGVLLARRRRSMRWLVVSFATVVLTNALLHGLGSLLTASYSPGLLTGLLLWGPLGAATLLFLRRRLTRRSFRAGLLVGLLIHVVVSLLALFGGLPMKN